MIEAMVGIFIFSILAVVLSSFLKQITLVEVEKKNTYKEDEEIHFLWDRIFENIRNRDKKNFYYKGKKRDIHIIENGIIYRGKNNFYKMEVIKNDIYISEGKNLENLGKKSKMGSYEKVEIYSIEDILVINMELNGKKWKRLVNIKEQ